MALFELEIADGCTFYSMMTILVKALGSVPLIFTEKTLSILKTNGCGTAIIQVNFLTEYIKTYKLNISDEELPINSNGEKYHIVNFDQQCLKKKMRLKKDDTLFLSQESQKDDVVSSVVSNLRSVDGGRSNFFNSTAEFQTASMELDEPVYEYKMGIDALCDSMVHAGADKAVFVIFECYSEGIKMTMSRDSNKITWCTSKKYTGDYYTTTVDAKIINELSKLSQLQKNGVCNIKCYGHGLLRISMMVGCFAELVIFLKDAAEFDEDLPDLEQ